MSRREYNAALRNRSLPYGALFFAVVIPGLLGSLYAAGRIASVSSWQRESVFLAMLPAFLAPILLGGWLMSVADRRLGLKCHSCGKSLSMGSHVRRLRRCGGPCPNCGTLVVDPADNAKPGVSPDRGPLDGGNSRATEGPPSVT